MNDIHTDDTEGTMGLKRLLAMGATLAFLTSAASADPDDEMIDPSVISQERGSRLEVTLVKDIAPGGEWGQDFECPFHQYNGELYFQSLAKSGDSFLHFLYKVTRDGKAVRVSRLEITRETSCKEAIVYQKELYFSAPIQDNIGWELHKVTKDGAVVRVKDINPGSASSVPASFKEYRGELYFRADGGPNIGTELYKVRKDGQVVLAADIEPGEGGSFPNGLIVFNGDLYFTANRSGGPGEIFKLTSNGTVVPVAAIDFVEAFTVFNGELYFTASGLFKLTRDDNLIKVADVITCCFLIVYNRELYIPDFSKDSGEPILHRLAGDGRLIPIGDVHMSLSLNPWFNAGYSIYRGELYFGGGTPAGEGGLFKVRKDGTAVLVSNTYAPGPGFLAAAEYNGELYYNSFDRTVGSELFKVRRDGRVVLAADIHPTTDPSNPDPQADSSNPDVFTTYRGSLYMAATASDDIGHELYRLGPPQQ